MLHAKGLPTRLWEEAVNTAVFVLNRTGNSSIPDQTPYQIWYKKNAKRKSEAIGMPSRGKVFLLDMDKETKGSDKVITACDVIFV